jgi:hypothetical protein
MQELLEPSVTKALSTASKESESSQEATPPIISTSESQQIMEVYLDWHPIHDISQDRGLPEDKDERERLRCHVGHYSLVNDELF